MGLGGRAARAKGLTWEREIANRLKEIDPTARRNVEETQTASVDIKTELPLAIQAKCLARWSLTPHSIYDQARGGALDEDHFPVGIVKINNKEPLVIMSFEDWLIFIERIYGKKESSSCL